MCGSAAVVGVVFLLSTGVSSSSKIKGRDRSFHLFLSTLYHPCSEHEMHVEWLASAAAVVSLHISHTVLFEASLPCAVTYSSILYASARRKR